MNSYFLEIKNRLTILLITLFSIIGVIYLYKEVLLFLVVNPSSLFNFDNLTFFYFIFTNVTDVFYVYIELTIFFSSQIFLIFSIYHSFIFFSPAFFKAEYKHIKSIVKIILTCWLVSIFISTYIIIPLTWSFFLSFQDLIIDKSFNIHFESKLNEYISFYISIYYMFGLYLQVFVLLFYFINYLNIDNKSVKKFRKLYYFIFIIFSTTVSPPDIFSQLLIGLFLIISYEMLLLTILIKKRLP